MSGQAVCAMYKHAGELYHSDAILAQAGTSLRTGWACGLCPTKINPPSQTLHQRVDRGGQRGVTARQLSACWGSRGHWADPPGTVQIARPCIFVMESLHDLRSIASEVDYPINTNDTKG